MNKMCLALFAAMSAMPRLSGISYSPDNFWGQILQNAYICAKDHPISCCSCICTDEQWHSKRVYNFTNTESTPGSALSITIPYGELAWCATQAACTEKNTKYITANVATAHIVAAVQKCQNLAGHIVENEQTIFTKVVAPWLQVNHTWQMKREPFFVEQLYDHG